MSIAFVCQGCILLLTTPHAVLLSVLMGVRGWMWPISVRSWHIGTASRTLMYNAQSSASAAKDITALMIWEMLRTVSLLCGLVMLDDMKKWPPAQLRAFGLLR